MSRQVGRSNTTHKPPSRWRRRAQRQLSRHLLAGVAAFLAVTAPAVHAVAQQNSAATTGWLRWRGPLQTGVSLETNLPDSIDVNEPRWTFDMSGRGAPVVANGRVYCMAYEGDGPELQEMIVCLDEETGEVLWDHRFIDFLSDVIYSRYAISSPSIDPETGNIFCLTTPGLLICFTPDGELAWQVPLMEKFGRFTYPNGRTLGPLVDGDLVILHTMTSNWGPHGPARDRFLAFDKTTGDNVWVSTPGGPPKDSPYSYPVFEWRDGERLLYAGTAGGNMVCVNALTGEPVWRYQMSIGGVCASPVLYGDQLIAVHGKENLDTSSAGRMISLRLGARPVEGGVSPLVLNNASEVWRNNELMSFTSSPVLVGNRIYITVFTGELCCVDADTGELLWRERLATDQIHASPAYGDGKLYVPMNNGSFYVVRPTDDGAEILSQTKLDGNCLGAPIIWNGKVYVHTTTRLYCFGADSGSWAGRAPADAAPMPGEAVALQILPAEVLVTPGEPVTFRARSIDANGVVVSESVETLEWSDNLLGVEFSADGKRANTVDSAPGASVLTAEADSLVGSVRFRVVYPHLFQEDFESVRVASPSPNAPAFGRPPAHWIGAFPKWRVVDLDGTKVLEKTIANPLFQRVMSFVGDPSQSNYTMQADVMSDGNRRLMSTVGVVNQRYLIVLKGNERKLEIQSNEERVKHFVPFRMTPNTWYTLKTRVDMEEDGTAVIRAKAWQRDESEPDDWTIEYRHANGHASGSPGIYGMALQSRHRVFVDNIVVLPN